MLWKMSIIQFALLNRHSSSGKRTLTLGKDSMKNIATVLQVSYSSLEPANNSAWEEACFSAELCVSRAHLQHRLQWGYPSKAFHLFALLLYKLWYATAFSGVFYVLTFSLEAVWYQSSRLGLVFSCYS